MRDDLSFDLRLQNALGRYAELAPSLDNAEIVRQAVGSPRLGNLFPVRRSAVRFAYLMGLLALLLVAVLVGVLIGAARPQLIIPLGRNGAIAMYIQGFNHSGRGSLVLLSDDGGNRAAAIGLCPRFSAYGTTLTYSSGDSPTLFVANADGSSPRALTDIIETDLDDPVTYALSPNGRFVAWFEDASLWLLPTDGGQRSQLLPHSGLRDETRILPAWSPGGDKIAFVTLALNPAGNYRSGVSVVDVDDAEVRVLSSRRAINAMGVSWSPEGRYVTYVGEPDGALPISTPGEEGPLDVFIAGVDGSGEHNLTNSAAYESQPEWSPDGARLAYVMWPSAEAERHVVTTPINGAVVLAPAVEGPATPWFVWSPDATSLLWLEGTTDGAGNRTNTLLLVDRDFQRPSSTLQSLEGGPLCRPTWQRLEP